MKQVTIEGLINRLQATAQGTQQENFLVLRDGEPVAVFLGIENKDEEDWRLQLSPEFWRQVEKWRQEKASVSLQELKAELFGGQELACRYSMLIHWSDEDKAYVATLPEFADA